MGEKKAKILLVDDEKDVVDSLLLRFEAGGYEVITAYDGQEALFKAQNESPDLIVLDLMLPKMDGYHVARLLKFDESYKDIPIIMLTARGQTQDKQQGLNCGADVYMVKPFDSKALIAEIERLLAARLHKSEDGGTGRHARLRT